MQDVFEWNPVDIFFFQCVLHRGPLVALMGYRWWPEVGRQAVGTADWDQRGVSWNLFTTLLCPTCSAWGHCIYVCVCWGVGWLRCQTPESERNERIHELHNISLMFFISTKCPTVTEMFNMLVGFAKLLLIKNKAFTPWSKCNSGLHQTLSNFIQPP